MRYGKNLTDFSAALLLLFLLLPLMGLITAYQFIFNGGKVFFSQQRTGKDGKIFRLWKFKTLRDSFDGKGVALPDKNRQFPAGNLLRASHLDELPQLFNVLKGELSLAGPRPLLPEYLPYYSGKEQSRHLVKPGLSGLTQLMGGNRLSWDQRFRLDAFYTEHCSFRLDMFIYLKTLAYLFRKKDWKDERILFSGSFIEYRLRQGTKERP
jgi:lipopolysaccharide/colanic/teichoic acid biosynthesis glycosyltransferase